MDYLNESRFPSCHTHPNDRLLQLNPRTVKLFILEVVIPILTIGFYNAKLVYNAKHRRSCHTHPNDRLLQLEVDGNGITITWVVIPILTIGFYNTTKELQSFIDEVVIPILTIGFYNLVTILLCIMLLKVVIPILTIGFYNTFSLYYITKVSQVNIYSSCD